MKNDKNKNQENNAINSISLKIASSDTILNWTYNSELNTYGKVTKPETINYKTHKPEKNGLFDERIFGPTKDFKCPVCSKKHKRSDVGKLCSSCGESIIESKMVRRRKMGYIDLATPVVHIWFSKVDYSIIRSIIGLRQDDLESIIYFKSHIVYDNGGFEDLKKYKIINIQEAPSIYRNILWQILEKENDNENKQEIQEKINFLESVSQTQISKSYGIDFYEYNEFIAMYSDIKIGTGAETIKKILDNIDLQEEKEKTIQEILKSSNSTSNSNFRKNKIIESFLKSGQKLSSMIFDKIPVIPADLRPLIQLDGGRLSTVDINELYRRVIIRNNRLEQWLKMDTPELIVQNEKRMLQESVDALIDNTRKKNPITSKDNRPLKSLTENLKGKQGRFRQNLLGKRVDYSGRSVIVVGPELKLHQVGLPKQMVVKLFEPFIVNLLVQNDVAKNIKQAKKMIEIYDDRIWKYAGKVIKNHPVLLNRAPTLHRLSIQAFEPIITSGKAIKLHPLSTPSFNADFDGDQMAVHVPLSLAAKKEALELMLSSKNILGPKDGKPIISPSQDIILGIYSLTRVKDNQIGEKRIYSNMNQVRSLLEMEQLSIYTKIIVPLIIFNKKFEDEINKGYKYLITSVGRLILNDNFSEDFPYLNVVNDNIDVIEEKYLLKSVNEIEEKFTKLENEKDFAPFKKGHISKLIEIIFERIPGEIADILDKIKDLGFKYSMFSGTSFSWTDIIETNKRESLIKEGDKRVDELQEFYEEGFITDDQRYSEVIKVWANVRENVRVELEKELDNHHENPLFMMMDSGARGNISNFVQLAGLRGSMSKTTHEYASLKRQNILVRSIEEIPIKSSFKHGLSPFEYFLSTNGARKGLSDTATKTAESGYLTRRLVDAVQDISITEEDCKTNNGVFVESIIDTKIDTEIENLFDRIKGRFSFEDIYDKHNNKIIGKNELITEEIAKVIISNNIKKVRIRSVLTCNSLRGVCKKCYGLDLSTNKEVNIGEAVGIIAAQSIGEPGTQLTMRTFHTGGIAGVADITQGFSRLMELVDANKNPKSKAIISELEGTISSIESNDFDKKTGQLLSKKITVQNENEKREYIVGQNQRIRVSVGEKINPGDKITDGSIQLQSLLKYAGVTATQNYLIKEIQRLYRIQGIEISDKYMEIIIKQMLSKFKVINSGDSNLYVSQIVSETHLRKINRELFRDKKQPVIAKQIILGVKPLPLYSDSFLASASYQRTSESLVNAAISSSKDELLGIKESLIVGNKIPVGTGLKKRYGKYDIFDDEEIISIIEKSNNFVSEEERQKNILKEVERLNKEAEEMFN